MELELLKMFYNGKSCNDADVQLRAPVDIFSLLKKIEKLENKIEELEEEKLYPNLFNNE